MELSGVIDTVESKYFYCWQLIYNLQSFHNKYFRLWDQMSSYHKRKKQGQNFIKLALSITESIFFGKITGKSLTPQSLTVWYHCCETTYTTQIFLYGIQYQSHIRKYQCCGAEIIYFRLRLRLQLHLCPLFRLRRQLYLHSTAIYCYLKMFYNSSTIPMEVEISFSSS